MRLIRLIGLFALIMIGVSFACLNAVPVNVNYYVGIHQFPLVVVLMIALGVGAVLGAFAMLSYVYQLRRSRSKLKKQVRLIEKEIKNLRSIPLKDEH